MKSFGLIIFSISLIISFKSNSFSQSGWISIPEVVTSDLKCAVILDSLNYVCAGNGEGVIVSSNSGSNWTQINTLFGLIRDIDFIDQNTGFVLDGYSIFKTTDKGYTWDYIDPGPYYKENIDFINESTGYVSGTDGFDNSPVAFVKKTTDGGVSWEHYQLLDLGSASNVKFFNETDGITLVCNRIHKTVNGGVNWTQQSSTNFNCFNSIFYINYDTIYIASFSGTIYKTLNGGLNWTQQITNTNLEIRDLFFLNANYGFAVGDSGLIIRTTDGGQNWIRQNSYTGLRLNDVYFLNENTGLIAGNEGLILRTTTGGLTFVNQTSNVIPDKFSLSQNYPNPFNPKTIINYELGITNNVKLKVFDVLGNEVAELVNEKQNAGTYSVDFDGSGIASGVYFYKLEAGEFAETKRMVLIK